MTGLVGVGGGWWWWWWWMTGYVSPEPNPTHGGQIPPALSFYCIRPISRLSSRLFPPPSSPECSTPRRNKLSRNLKASDTAPLTRHVLPLAPSPPPPQPRLPQGSLIAPTHPSCVTPSRPLPSPASLRGFIEGGKSPASAVVPSACCKEGGRGKGGSDIVLAGIRSSSLHKKNNQIYRTFFSC